MTILECAPSPSVETLFCDHLEPLRRRAGAVVRRLGIRDRHECEDLVQDSLCRVLRRIRARAVRAASLGELHVYVGAAARNAALDALRRRRRAVPAATDAMVDLGQQAAPSAAHRWLREVLACVDLPSRELFERHLCDGLPLAELARERGEKDGTVRKRFARALRRLFESRAMREILEGCAR